LNISANHHNHPFTRSLSATYEVHVPQNSAFSGLNGIVVEIVDICFWWHFLLGPIITPPTVTTSTQSTILCAACISRASLSFLYPPFQMEPMLS